MEIKNLLTVRQFAKKTGKSYRTIMNYLANGKIEYHTIDYIKVIPREQIEVALAIDDKRKQSHSKDGYQTVLQASKAIGINTQTFKKHITNGRVEYLFEDGIYYVPNDVVALWSMVLNPNPNKVEAYQMNARTIQQAGKDLGYADSTIRRLIADDELKTIDGFNRKYVTIESIEKFKSLRELADTL